MNLFKLITHKNQKPSNWKSSSGSFFSNNWKSKLNNAEALKRLLNRPAIRKALGLSIIMLSSCIVAQAQVSLSGTVFRDYNGNGIQGKAYPNMEPGVAEIAVCAFDSTDQLLSVVLTDQSGYYSMSTASVPIGRSVRLEFIIQGTGGSCYNDRTYDYSSTSASTYGSAIQFLKGGATNVNFALNYPGDYVLDNNPYIYMSCFVTGDPLKAGSAATSDAFIKVRKSFSGEPLSQGGASSDNAISIGRADSLGSVWGVAFSRPANKIFTSAFVKRHVGLGPMGSGGVYMIDPNAVFPATTQRFFSLDNLGFPTSASSGALKVLSNTARNLPNTAGDPSHDSTTYAQVGKVGIGGLEISDDGRYLFLINLFDKKLYKIDLQNGASPVMPTAAQVSSYALPNPGCTNGLARPFAVKYFRNKVYVGIVCSGENGGTNNVDGTPSDVYANVYAFDAVNNVFDNTPVIPTVNLAFHKGMTNATINPNDTLWNPWSDQWHLDANGEITFPQPILSDIEFDNDGSMILGFMDRTGHQLGYGQYGLNSNDITNIYSGFGGGDVIRVFNNACTYEVESNGVAGPITTSGNQNYQGLGGGEFYWEDNYIFWHDETSFGSLGMQPGDSVVTVAVANPQTFFGAGGISHFSNIDGSKSYGFQVYDPSIAGTCANANGLGDQEYGFDAEDIEIGNIVWDDTHNFGIQDADEKGISGVNIQLIRVSDNAVIGNATSNSSGQWYFNKSNVNLNGASGLLPNTSYKIRVAAAQFNNTGSGPLANKDITNSGMVGNGEPGMSDNDATLVSGKAEIAFTTTKNGASNHNLDFGFKSSLGCPLVATCSSTNTTCNGGADGEVSVTTVGAVGAVDYLWSTASTNAAVNGLAAGTYTVTVTDSQGCSDMCSVTIGQPTAVSASCSGTNVTVNGGNNGSVSVTANGGTPGYTYLWNNGSTNATQSGLAASTYTVTVIDANACTGTCSITISQPLPLSGSVVITDINCNGGNDGEIALTILGGVTPYSYLWSNGATTQDINNLFAGNYDVTVTDNAGATITFSNTVSEPTAVQVTCTSVDASSNGGNNGQASVSANGGTPSYTYLWSNGKTTATATGLIAGVYTVNVTDSRGCSTTCESNVGEPGAIFASIAETNVSCFGGSDGALDLTANGGVGTLTFLWNDGDTNEDRTNLSAGSYTVTVTDGNGITKSVSGTVSESGQLSANCSHTNVTINGANDGTASVTAIGGTLPYTYQWSNGGTTATINGLSPLIYNVIVTDNNGCTANCAVTITQPSVFTGTVIETNVSCNGVSDGTISITSNGGVTPYTFAWDDGNTNEDRTGLAAGSYTLTATDNNGATYTKSITITEPDELIANCSHTDILVNGANNGTGTVQVSGGTAPYTYSWNNGASTASISNLAAGSYIVNVTDDNGCSAACGFTITEPTALDITVSGTNVSCNGGSNGTIDVTVAGGVATYNYLWNDGDTNEDRTGIAAGLYIITVTDANGATSSQTINITEPSALTLNCSKTNITINGANDGSACVLASGGSPSYAYLWSNGETTQCIANLAPGAFTVTVTDNHSCTQTCSVNITQPAILNIVPVPTNVSCNGGIDGGINVSVNGGVTPYTYIWNDGNTNQDRTNVGAGTYTITVTDKNGATAVAVASVTQPSAIALNCSAVDVTVNGAGDGSASVTVSGGTPSYSYLWSNSETTQSIANLTPGTYIVTVTDNNGCTSTCSSLVTEPALLAINGTATNVTCNALSDGSIDVTATGGIGAYTFLWNDGDTNEDRTNLAAGSYTVTVTDGNGAVASTSINVNEPSPINSTCSGSNVTINGGSDGSACAFANGGNAPYTFAWSNSATSQCINNLSAATYIVVITDNKGCTISCEVVVTEPAALSATSVITDVTCNGANDGIIVVTATGGETPYSYLWNNGSTNKNRSNLAAGSYTVTVTDNNGATFELISTVNEPAALTANCSATDVTVNGTNDGSASAIANGGTAPYSYLWSNGETSSSLSNLAPGSYGVTVTDANGCTADCSATVNEPLPLTASTQSTDNLCNSANNGTADVTASGGVAPYTYLWSNGSTDASIINLLAGTYTATVTDANGATAQATAVIAEPSLLTATCSSNDITIFGAANGTASVTGNGGTKPYSYLWTNGATTKNINGLSAGSYVVYITDANGCSAMCSVTINEPALLEITATSTDVLCNGGNDGTTQITATGGVTSYTFSWSDGSTDEDRNDLIAGSYVVTVTDANGAIATAAVSITEPDALVLTCNHIDVSGPGAADGSACALPSKGTPGYTFLWSTGSTDQCISSVGGGAYTVTVTDANGCTASCVSIIFEPGLFAVSATGANVTCNGLNDGTIDATLVGGVLPVTYLWNDGNTNEDRNGLSAGTYTVVCTDNTGATVDATVTITEPASLTLALTSTDVTIFGANNGAVTSSVTGGTTPYSYWWNNGDTNADLSGVGPGIYSVEVTDANGCTISQSATVNEPAQLTVVINATPALFLPGFCDGLADLTAVASGGVTPYSYLWSDGSTDMILQDVSSGTYTVTVTDVNGATATNEYQFIAPVPPSITCSGVNVTVNGGNNGSAAVTIANGNGNESFLWSNGDTNSSANNLIAGTYTVIVTDANGCTASCDVTLTEPLVLSVSLSSVNVTCNGAANGTAYATATGGNAPYTYIWSNGKTDDNINSLDAGVYTVIVTDNSNNTVSNSVVISEPALLTANCSATNITQNGLSDGTVSVSANGGTSPYSYTWSNGATTSSAAGLTAGSYTVIVTDANQCSVECTSIVNEPGVLSLNIATIELTCYNANNGQLTAQVTGGTTPYSYLWSNGNTNAVIQNAAAATYTVTATDAAGVSVSMSTTLTNPSEIIVNCSGTDVSCGAIPDGTLLVNATGGSGSLSYLWSNGDTNSSVSNVAAGTYTIVVTDSKGCTASCSVTLNGGTAGVCSIKKVHPITCNGGSDGVLEVIAAGNNTYLWSNGATTSVITGLTKGNYTVTVTNLSGCTSDCMVCLFEPKILVCNTLSTPSVCNACDGGASVTATGGVQPYTYLWSNGATNDLLYNLCGGNYSVTVTDNRGCTTICNVKVDAVGAKIECTIAKDHLISCNGGNNGELSVSVVGGTAPYAYLWNNGATTSSVSGLMMGTYSVIVTDANGCNTSCSAYLGQPLALVCNTASTPSICNACDGTASVAVTGGVQPYTYLWSNGSTTDVLSNLCDGNYTVTVTDNRGCTTMCNVKVDAVGAKIECTIAKDHLISCNGGNNGELSVSVVGGTAPYTYLWNNGATTSSVSGLSMGTYSVIVTDANGCNTNCSAYLGQPLPLVCNTISTAATCGLCNGTASVAVTGGVQPYTYLWSNGATTDVLNNLCDGNYTVTITDKRGCTTSCNVKVDNVDELFTCLIIKNKTVSCHGGNDGEVTATTIGGTAPFTYLWNNGATTASLTNVPAGWYTVVVTSAAGCTATDAVCMLDPTVLSCSATGTNAICGACNGTTTVTAMGGKAPYTFLWSNGATASTLTGLCGGSYVVTVTDRKGCTSTCMVKIDDIADNTKVIITLDEGVSCHGAKDGGITAVASGGTGPYTYLWSNGATTAQITGIGAGTYNVTATSALGCTAIATYHLSQPTALNCNTTTVESTCGQCNGSATVSGSGGTAPYTYLWSNGDQNATAAALCAGMYTVTVTDAHGCTSICNATITDNSDNVQCKIDIDSPISCHGANNAVISAVASGGTAPYSYLWNNGSIASSLSNVGPGSYSVTVTSAGGCTTLCMVNVTEPKALTCTTMSKATLCKMCNGNATVMAVGGTAPYTYLWVNGQVTATATGLCSGKYPVTVTDANGCSTECEADVYDAVIECNGFVTGHKQNYYNPWKQAEGGYVLADYLNANFAFMFPNGLTVGGTCPGAFNIHLSTASDVTTFLPSTGNTNLLKQSYVNPLPGDVNNELASQLVALALNIRFDLLDPNFSPNSTVSFKDMLVDSGPMAGMTVMEVYNEGNAALSGCASKFTRALLRTFIAHINSSWSLGKQRNNVLTCPKDPCGKTWKDVTADGDFLQFGAYPNPSAGVLNIEFIDNNTHTTSIQLYDLTGKLVYTQEGQSRTGYNKVTLNLENLPKGVYMLRATVNLDTRNVRVILQ